MQTSNASDLLLRIADIVGVDALLRLEDGIDTFS